jgi:hypothetical protein
VFFIELKDRQQKSKPTTIGVTKRASTVVALVAILPDVVLWPVLTNFSDLHVPKNGKVLRVIVTQSNVLTTLCQNGMQAGRAKPACPSSLGIYGVMALWGAFSC